MKSDRGEKSQRGTILLVVALTLIPLIGLAAIALDGYRFLNRAVEQASNAELAGLAALEEFTRQGSFVGIKNRMEAGKTKAEEVASRNRYVGAAANAPASAGGLSMSISSPGPSGSIVFGTSPLGCMVSGGAECFVPSLDPLVVNAVRVELRETDSLVLRTIFGAVFGKRFFNKTSRLAVVRHNINNTARGANPFEIVLSR